MLPKITNWARTHLNIGRIPGAMWFGSLMVKYFDYDIICDINGNEIRAIYTPNNGLLYFWEGYKGNAVREMKNNLREGDICLDIGAGIGYFTVQMADIVERTGQVHAFEPSPYRYDGLRDNLKRNKLDRVETHQLALSDADGEIVMELGESFATLGKSQKISVTTAEYDNLDLPDPDFLKLDVEGAELKVLRGMAETLERANPIILCEVHHRLIEEVGDDIQKLEQFLEGKNYRFELITDAGTKQVNELLDDGSNHHYVFIPGEDGRV